MNTHELWQAALGELELKLSKAHFTTWFRNTFIADFDQTKVIVGVPNTFTKAWLEKKYHRDILDSLRNITEQDIRLLEYRVETRSVAPMPVVLNSGEEIIQPESVEREDFGFTTTTHVAARETIAINNTYTFDTFIVGKQNELAHAASQAVAAQPG
ncbi:MAG: DnaA N-terminal domain-containing protein, partial [Patescibacteria group bacterium]